MRYSTGRRPWRSEPVNELNNAEYSARQKVFFLALLTILLFGILTLQLAKMQLINGSTYALRAETNRLRLLPTAPTRGLIYDRNGIPLVENRASFAVAVVAADIPEARQMEISIALQEMTGIPASEIDAKVDARRISNDPFSPAIVKDNLPQEVAFKIRERLAAMPGVRIEVQSRRLYTEGAQLTHVLGFVGRVNEEEYAELAQAGYQPSDSVGKTGVELTYESVLRGTPGARQVETDASGREIRVLSQTAAKPGSSLVLTLDLDLQKKVTEYLVAAMGASQNAAAVVIDVKTGEIISMVSLPNYDGNVFTGEVDEGMITKLLTDAGKPLVNHAIAEMYPPGSTFKQITGLAALQEGVATAGTRITSLGSIQVPNQYDPRIVYTFRDWAALGTLDFYGGIAMSSDVYFYYLSGGFEQNGKQVFDGLGATRLAEWARRFGLGSETGIDIPGESAGLVPDPTWKEKTIGEPWFIGDTYNFGIGQGFMATTPIQMAVATAAIANGGDVLVPHVVREIRDSNGNIRATSRTTVKRNLNVDPRNIKIMHDAMRQAVETGTARTASSRNVAVAGKTGTAEFGERRPNGSYKEHGWFTGYAPFNNPEIAIVVFLEQGGGALTAAPVASKIFDYYFARNRLAQSGTP